MEMPENVIAFNKIAAHKFGCEHDHYVESVWNIDEIEIVWGT